TPDRAPLLPDHADVPALRHLRDARLPAGEVQAALPGADPLRRARPARGQGPRPARRPRRAGAHPGEPLGDARGAQVGLVRMTRRVLITGLSTYWGGRLAKALEGFPEVE